MQTDGLFFGIPKSGVRKYLSCFLSERLSEFNVYVFPTCGRFVSTEVTIDTGVNPAYTVNGDITLFSTVLGFFYSDADLATWESLGITLSDSDWGVNLEELYKNNPEMVARFLLCLKYHSIKDTDSQDRVIYYNRSIKREMFENRDVYILRLTGDLVKLKEKLGGLVYTPGDMMLLMDDYKDREDAFLFVDPPIYSTGDYNKMFDTNGVIGWNPPDVEQIDSKMLNNYFITWAKYKCTIMMFVSAKDLRDLERFDLDGWNRVYCYRHTNGRRDYLLVNKPLGKKIVSRGFDEIHGKNLPLISKEDIDGLTNKAHVDFVLLSDAEAYYYRNLFIHTLKENTGADAHFAVLLDGKIFAVTGISLKFLWMDNKDYIFVTYGIALGIGVPKIPKLLVKLMTCRDFKNLLERNFYMGLSDLRGVKEVSLTKIPEDRTNRGVMKLINRESLGELYKLTYYAEFNDKTYKQCIDEWIKELRKYERGKS